MPFPYLVIKQLPTYDVLRQKERQHYIECARLFHKMLTLSLQYHNIMECILHAQ